MVGITDRISLVRPDKRRTEEEGRDLTQDGTKLMHQQLFLQMKVMLLWKRSWGQLKGKIIKDFKVGI